jgi:hypothetical protein
MRQMTDEKNYPPGSACVPCRFDGFCGLLEAVRVMPQRWLDSSEVAVAVAAGEVAGEGRNGRKKSD